MSEKKNKRKIVERTKKRKSLLRWITVKKDKPNKYQLDNSKDY